MDREPLVTVGSVSSVLSAAFVLLVAFGLPIDDAKQAAILGFAAVVFPFLSPLLARSRVTPVADPRDDEGNALVADAGEVSALFVLTVLNSAMLVYLCLKALGAI